MPNPLTGLTQIKSTDITDGSITNAKISPSPSIPGTKVDVDLGIAEAQTPFNIGLLGFKKAVNEGLTIFNLMDGFIKSPDLLVYLRASVTILVEQIQKRGRDYENSIRLDYLTRLNERYEAWISTYDKGKILIIDVDNNHFNDNQEDLGKIISKVDAELHGLF